MKIKYRIIPYLILAITLVACAHAPLTEVSPSPVAASSGVKDAKTAQFESLTEAAQQGNLDAQFMLAQAYEVGKGVGMDVDKAFYWYGKAANAGHIPSQYFLGAMYGSSRGTPIDIPMAIFWYRKAADQGYPDALYPMAYAYEYGLGGLQQDFKQALGWYRKAADAGNPFAFIRLEKAYRLGELGLKIDSKKARVFKDRLNAVEQAEPVGKQK